jgi:hypothetical protein
MFISNEILEKVTKHALQHLNSRKDILPNLVNLHLHTYGLENGQALTLGINRIINISRESILVFVDHAPLYNWGHACEHMLYDATNGEHYKTYASQFPPDSYFHTPGQYTAIHSPVAHPPVEKSVAVEPARLPQLDQAVANATGKKYAILFSGLSNYRHLNDLEFLYRTLLDIYKFDAANIIVLNYDGTVNYSPDPNIPDPQPPATTWPGNNTPYRIKVNDSGSITALGQAFDTMKEKLTSEDLLLVHTNNHGSTMGGKVGPIFIDLGALLVCYPDWKTCFTTCDFGNKLKMLPPFKSLVVMMEQCYAGGFKKTVLNNSPASSTSFASSCTNANSSMGGPNFNPFAQAWIAAVTGNNPDGSPLSKPVPQLASAYDAFTYANAVKVEGDTPVYSDKPTNGGTTQYLTA